MDGCRIETYPAPERLLAEEVAEGKFLQFIWRGEEYLLFAARQEHRFHNQMLARFLADHGISHHWRDEQTLVLDSDELKTVGGGRFWFERAANRLELWDSSQAYGPFDPDRLPQKIRGANHPWSDVQVVIR